MNKLIALLMAAVILAGCQGEDNKEAKDAAETPAKSSQPADTENSAPAEPVEEASNVEASQEAAAETDEHAGHDHGPMVTDGAKYQKLEKSGACEAPVVIEFFAYHCPHCYALEPSAEKWRKKNNGKVNFIAIPTTLGHDQLGSMLLVHHAAKLLGVLEKTQHALFERFHKEKKLFASEDEAAEFLAAQGADKAEALAMLKNQDAMMKSINADYELLKQYQISSVPQVLVNHQYMTNITIAGGHDEVFEVVDETLQLEHSCGTK